MVLGVLFLLLFVALGLVAAAVALLLALIALAIYTVVVLPVNLLLLVWTGLSALFYWLKTRFDGKAIMQRRLEGRIPLLKQKALKFGLDLVELDRQSVLIEYLGERDEDGANGVPGNSKGGPPGTSAEWTPETSEQSPHGEVAGEDASVGRLKNPNLNRREIKMYRRLFGFDDDASRARFDPWVPLWSRLRTWLTSEDRRRETDTETPGQPSTSTDALESSVLRDSVRRVRAVLRGLLGSSSADSDPGRPFGSSPREFLGLLRDDELDDERFPPHTRWVYDTMIHLNTADASLRRSMGTAYESYLTAKRHVVEGEYDLHRLRAEIDPRTGAEDGQQFLRSEASVVLYGLNDYDEQTRKIVTDILCDDQADPADEGTEPKPKESLKITELKQALKELHEYRLREYRQFEILRINILMFVGLPIVSLIGLLIVVPSFMTAYPSLITTLVPLTDLVSAESPPPLPVEGVVIHSEQVFFGLVLGFGALGAALSGMRKIEHDTRTSESLESILGYWLALVRMSIGAISAFVVLVFLSSGLLDQTILSLPLVLGISAASGVSERLALKAISSFESRALPETEREPKTETESPRPT
ncbi:Yip1 family protein [Salinigranum sp. GCM10025319]|uniref:Yip1 family protein n=1 Tax=Salinigranum sp. GCM10025319 TaxID=3252687 RepID=UPI003607601A